jgi:phosphatidylglycerol:prolipoprotein diacylglycerol transferase
LLWVFEHLGEDTLSSLIFSRGGLSWFGGFAGGVLAGLLVMQQRRLPAIATLAAATPGLAVGHAIGRVGCFMVGDDYGHPTDLPWGVAFPRGLPPTDIPVHPTQLYEAAALMPVFLLLLRWRKEGRSDTFVLGSYLVLAGALRFAIEFLRVDRRVLGVLSVAHLASLAAIAAGFVLLLRPRGASRAVPAR